MHLGIRYRDARQRVGMRMSCAYPDDEREFAGMASLY